MYPLMQRPGPRCADCGAHVDDVDLRWNGDMRSGYWVCADDEAGCAARVAQRADALVARVEAHAAPPSPIWPEDEAAHVAETVDELRGGTCSMLYEHEYERGDNGGCECDANYHCDRCQRLVCVSHQWLSDTPGEDIICSVCYGITGVE